MEGRFNPLDPLGVFGAVKKAVTTEAERIAAGTKRIGDTYVPPPIVPEVKATSSEWLAQFDPKTSARYKLVLDKPRMINRQPNTQAKYVEEAVANGAIVTRRNGRRVLQHPDGRFLYESDLSKVALDYAEFLIATRK